MLGIDSPRYGGMIYNPVDDFIYSIADNTTNPVLVRIDRITGVVTPIGEVTQVSPDFLDFSVTESLEFNPDDGLVYMGAGFTNDPNNNFFSTDLYTLDLATGDATLVGDFNGSCQTEADGLAYLNGTMYYLDGCPNPQTLGTVDLSNGNQNQLLSGSPGSRFENNSADGNFWFVDATDREIFTVDLNGNSQLLGELYPEGSITDPLSRGLTTAPVTRTVVQGGALFGGPFEYCQNNPSQSDLIDNSTVTLQNDRGTNRQWIITDAAGIIVGLVDEIENFDFGSVSPGEYNIWNVRYEGNLNLNIGTNAADLDGCFDLSNSLDVSVANCFQLPNEIVSYDIIDKNDQLAVYPNPSYGEIQVRLESDLEADEPPFENLIVYNSSGMIVLEKTIDSKNEITYQLDTSEWSEGLYLISVKSATQVLAKSCVLLR